VSIDAYRPSAELVERLRALSERRLSRKEVEAALRTPVGDSEREEILELVAWFRRRYPTPLDRLAYVRRAYRRWQNALELRDEGHPGEG
jgi:hypothetical protein